MSRLEWPLQLGERTPPAERTRNNSLDVSLARAFDALETDLERMGVDDFRYSFDAQQRKRDGRPYSRARPDDPGFVCRWTMDGEQYAVGCDVYSRLRDNVRTVGLYVHEKRMMEQRPVATGETEFSNLRLPSPEDVVEADPPAYAVLGVDPEASEQEIRAAFRERVKETHPDLGGDRAEHERVKRAREVLLS